MIESLEKTPLLLLIVLYVASGNFVLKIYLYFSQVIFFDHKDQVYVLKV